MVIYNVQAIYIQFSDVDELYITKGYKNHIKVLLHNDITMDEAN